MGWALVSCGEPIIVHDRAITFYILNEKRRRRRRPVDIKTFKEQRSFGGEKRKHSFKTG